MADNFILKRISDVICINATVADKYDFFATHVPFKNLKFANSGTLSQKPVIVSEEDFFREELMNKRDMHNFIVIKGDAGSGKSHFIRWVSLRYKNAVDTEREIIISISREQNTLRGALEQIIESDVFSDNFKADELKILINAREHLNENTLKLNILAQFDIACEDDSGEEFILDKRYQKKVHDYLMDRAVKNLLFKENGPIERIMSRLTAESQEIEFVDFVEPKFYPNDFIMDYSSMQNEMRESSKQARKLAEDLCNDEKGPTIREKLADYLNSKLDQVVQNCTNLRAADLKRIFEKLRMELKTQGKNLTLFIEDITSFTGVDRAVMEVLVTEHRGTEHNEKFCRIISVVGITTPYYLKSFPDNLRDRVTGRVEIDDAILTNSRETAEMAARYINAINLESEVLIKWMKDENADNDRLPISDKNKEHDWANLTLFNNKVMSIFPFNETALWKMYQGISENDRTPREFLKRVILNVFKLYVSKPNEFPPSPTVLSGFFKMPQWHNTIHEQKVEISGGENSNRLKSLFLLWGDASISATEVNGEKKVGLLSRNVFESFNLPIIDSAIEAIPPPKQPVQPAVGDGAVEILSTPLPVNDKEFRAIQAEIYNWHDKGEKLRNYQKLRDDVCDVLTDFIDWKSLGIPSSLVGDFFRRSFVSIEGQIGIVKPGFQVKRNSLSKYALLALASWRYLGKTSWNFEGAEDQITNLQRWMLSVKEEAVASVTNPQEIKDVDISKIPKYAILVEFYVNAFTGCLNLSVESTTDIYNKIYQKFTAPSIQEGRSKIFRDVQSKLVRKNNELLNHHEMIMQYYNCIQGDITRSAPDNYFENAAPILDIIRELKKSDWDIDKLDIQDLDSKNDNVCYRSVKLLGFFKEVVAEALEGEKEKSRDTLAKLDTFTDGDYSSENINALFKDMKDFFIVTLASVNGMNYNTEDFEFLTSNQGTPRKFLNAHKALQDALNSETRNDQLTRYSANPNAVLEPYINLFQKFNKFLDDTIRKYDTKLEGVINQVKDIESIITHTTDLFANITNDLNIMSKGGRSND
jgi:hypothetical protein